MEVNQFLSSLSNLEKTRHFDVIKNYSLDGFQLVLESFGILRKRKSLLRVSVVGTNGKGSIAYYLSQFGFRSKIFPKVGLYTSPHLITQNERIQINGTFISDLWLNKKLNSFSSGEIIRLQTLSYFEFFTFLAIIFFTDKSCNLEIYEAGLGGRLDATKLTYPDIVILTKIELDHTEILGSTKEEILIEKLQIISDKTKYLYTFKQEDNLMNLINSFCQNRKIHLIIYDKEMNLDYLKFNKDFSFFIINDILDKKNIAKINESIFPLIEDISGRMQVISEKPLLVFDIGHNPSAVEHLLKSLQIKFPNETNWQVYLACLKDKDVKSILRLLIENEFIKKVFQIQGKTWNEESLSNQKIQCISQDQFQYLIKNSKSTSLVLGSFRLYNLVKA